MRHMTVIILAALLLLFVGCKKDIDIEQIKKDFSGIEEFDFPLTNSNCVTTLDRLEIYDRLGNSDKLELWVRYDLSKKCELIRNYTEFNFVTNMFEIIQDSYGLAISQHCLKMEYKVFDDGHKFVDYDIVSPCSHDIIFLAKKAKALESFLKNQKDSSCTCK